ncbi:unnamed protein product [Chrysoparadoxa australica]
MATDAKLNKSHFNHAIDERYFDSGDGIAPEGSGNLEDPLLITAGSGSEGVWNTLYWKQWRIRRAAHRHFERNEWSKKPLWLKLLSLLEWPLLAMRNITIPPVEGNPPLFHPL